MLGMHVGNPPSASMSKPFLPVQGRDPFFPTSYAVPSIHISKDALVCCKQRQLVMQQVSAVLQGAVP